MDAKEWLLRGCNIDDEITALQKARQIAFDRATSATANYEKTGGSTSPNPHKFDKLAVLDNQIDERIDSLLAVKNETVDSITKVSDTRLRTVLIMRYVNSAPWEVIAGELGLECRQIHRLHKKALAEIQEIVFPESA